jgi:hypothetical protein
MRRRATRRSALLIAVAMIAGVMAATMGTASALASPAVTVTPSTNLVNAQVVSVQITADETRAGVMYAVTQCGNANSAGNSIAPGNADDCAGQSGIGTTLRLISDNLTPDFAAVAGGVTSGHVYTIGLTLQKSGIGVNGAQCLPVGGAITNPCTVAVAEADATQPVPNVYGQTVVPITYRPPSTVAITSVTGQNAGVTTAARSGNTLNISGINWDHNETSATVAASLCNVTLTSCDAAGLTGSVATDGSGALTSTGLTVTGTATTGARALRITDGTQTASVPVQVLGARILTLSASTGGLGLNLTVNGSGFDASQAVAVQALGAAPTFTALGAPVMSTSSALGAVNAVFPIADSGTKFIAVAETDAPLTDNAMAPFVVSADTCNNTGCTVVQTVSLTVDPGVINITQAGHAVGMSLVTLDGTQKTSTGALQGITITDARGTLNGWSVTATMNNLTGPGGSNSTIPAGNMTVDTPTCHTQSPSTGSNTGITAGATAQAFDPTIPVHLCTAAPGEGGGTYSVGSGLSLTVPATIRSGTYTSTITVLLT